MRKSRVILNEFGLPATGRRMTAARYLLDVGLYGVSRIKHETINIAVSTLSIFISIGDAGNKQNLFKVSEKNANL